MQLATIPILLIAASATWSFSLASAADILFSDPAEALTRFTVVTETDSSAAVIDYSTLGIPEAPGMLVGTTLPTTGFQLIANKGDQVATPAGLNLILGTDPITFTGLHTLEFYVWMNIPSDVSATSEALVAGVARANFGIPIYGNFRSSRGDGAWFIQGNDNGLSVDHRELNNGTSVLAWNAPDPDAAPRFDAAFTNSLAGPVAEAGNEWVKVDLVFDPDAASTTFFMNNVMFGSVATTNTSGFAWFGYEDSAGSIAPSTALSGIFDNIRVVEGNAVIPEPNSLVLCALGAVAFALRRRR